MNRLFAFFAAFVAVIGAAIFYVPSASAQLIKYCGEVGNRLGTPTSCVSSCSGMQVNVASMRAYIPEDYQFIMNSLCGDGQVCCADRGDALCSKGTALLKLQGSCSATCPSGTQDIGQTLTGTPALCTTGSCCVPVGQGGEVVSGSAGGGNLQKAKTGVSPAPAVAAAPPQPGYGLINPLGSRSIPTLAADLIKWISGIAGAAFTVYLLWGGVEWMTSSGDGKKTLAARNKILYAVLGIAIIFLSYFMLDALIGITNIQF